MNPTTRRLTARGERVLAWINVLAFLALIVLGSAVETVVFS